MQWTALAGTVLLLGQTSLADDAVSVLINQRVADMTGKEGTVISVDYASGAASGRHLHPGSVYAYVLEESWSLIRGEQAVTYTESQSRYASPKKPYVVYKNASTTEPAKLLVFLLYRRISRFLYIVSAPLSFPADNSANAESSAASQY